MERNDDFFDNDNIAQQFIYNNDNNNNNNNTDKKAEESNKNKMNLGGVSNKDIREELETAINQATKQHDEL